MTYITIVLICLAATFAVGTILDGIPRLKKHLSRHPIGLMGVSDGGMLYTPSGTTLFRAPMWLASIIQRTQHRVSEWSRKWAPPITLSVPGYLNPIRMPAEKPAKKVSRYELARRRWKFRFKFW